MRAGISPQEAQANLEPLLNILHFKTKQNFYTTQMYEQKNKVKVRRHNKGPSLIVPDLISVAPLQEEQGLFSLSWFLIMICRGPFDRFQETKLKVTDTNWERRFWQSVFGKGRTLRKFGGHKAA